MVHYSCKPEVSARAAHAKISNLRCHFKNTFETANAIRGKNLREAQRYYRQVLSKTRCIPFRVYASKIGRTAQAKEHGVTKGRWPRKSVVVLLQLLDNAAANATSKGLDPAKMTIKHIQVDQAPRTRRRTYRAHGRIGPFMCSPCHVQLFLVQPEAKVPVPTTKPMK